MASGSCSTTSHRCSKASISKPNMRPTNSSRTMTPPVASRTCCRAIKLCMACAQYAVMSQPTEAYPTRRNLLRHCIPFDTRGHQAGVAVDVSPVHEFRQGRHHHAANGSRAHRSLVIGTIEVDADASAATIPSLFTAGKCSGYMYGSNRLGNNSMSDLLVFGHSAGLGTTDYVRVLSSRPAVSPETVDTTVKTLRVIERRLKYWKIRTHYTWTCSI